MPFKPTFWKTVLLFITALVLIFIISLYIVGDKFRLKVHPLSSPIPESWYTRRISQVSTEQFLRDPVLQNHLLWDCQWVKRYYCRFQAIHNARLLDFPIPTCKHLNSSDRWEFNLCLIKLVAFQLDLIYRSFFESGQSWGFHRELVGGLWVISFI